MTVGIKIDGVLSEIGSAEFFSAFFSTISYRLEAGRWGEKFPMIMNELYQGKLLAENAGNALQKLESITVELSKFSPEKVVWDIDNLETRPPWGDNISDEITDLSNYFVTSTGRNLIVTIHENIEALKTRGSFIEVVTY